MAGQRGGCKRAAYQYAKGPIGTHNSPLDGEEDYSAGADSPVFDSDDLDMNPAASRLPGDSVTKIGIAQYLVNQDTG